MYMNKQIVNAVKTVWLVLVIKKNACEINPEHILKTGASF